MSASAPTRNSCGLSQRSVAGRLVWRTFARAERTAEEVARGAQEKGLAAEMSGELGSKSGEPFSSSLGWLVERIADESADIAPAAAAVGPPRAEESAESSAYGKAW